MNYMDVYTPYTLSFAVAITAIIMVSAVFTAYVVIKVRKTVLFLGYILVQIVLLTWLSAKLLELTSPTIEISNLYISLQQISCLLLTPALLLFLYGMWRCGVDKKQVFRFCTFIFACVTYVFFGRTVYFSDSAPLFFSIAFNFLVFLGKRSIFAELSEVSVDMFMERLEDAVIIFDRSGKLLDSNRNAKSIIDDIEKTEKIEDFFNKINNKIVSGSRLEATADSLEHPVEISMEGSSGIRHYMYNMTIAKNRKNIIIATVITFHDVTEKTMLLHELECKNTELDRLNTQLKSYITVANRLEEEREKNRVIMEIQETIGHSITELLVGLEVLQNAGNEHEKAVKEKLNEIIDKCRNIMSEIRISVEKLMRQSNERK